MIVILEDTEKYMIAAKLAAKMMGIEIVVIDNVQEAITFITKNHSKIDGVIVDGDIKGRGHFETAAYKKEDVIIKMVEHVLERYYEILKLTGLEKIEQDVYPDPMSIPEVLTDNMGEDSCWSGNTEEITILVREFGIPYKIFTNFHNLGSIIVDVAKGNTNAKEAGEAIANFLCLESFCTKGDEKNFNLLRKTVSEKRFIMCVNKAREPRALFFTLLLYPYSGRVLILQFDTHFLHPL